MPIHDKRKERNALDLPTAALNTSVAFERIAAALERSVRLAEQHEKIQQTLTRETLKMAKQVLSQLLNPKPIKLPKFLWKLPKISG